MLLVELVLRNLILLILFQVGLGLPEDFAAGGNQVQGQREAKLEKESLENRHDMAHHMKLSLM